MNNKELQQFKQVAGLDPFNYPGGRTLPDPELLQDPAFLAFKLKKQQEIIDQLCAYIDVRDKHPQEAGGAWKLLLQKIKESK